VPDAILMKPGRLTPDEFNLIKQHTVHGRDALRATVKDTLESLYHPVSSCRMGADSDEQAVVDPQLRVRGIAGLRIADASVMLTFVDGKRVYDAEAPA